MQARKRLLEQGEATPSGRAELQTELRTVNQRILQTPVFDYHDPSYTRVKFLRYADDVAVGVIGPKALAEHVKEEIGTFLQDELKLALNPEKTRLIHLSTEKARFLGYDIKMLHKWLNRRGGRKPLNGKKFALLMEQFPLPKARVVVSLF